MTNTIALWLAILIVGFLALDRFYLQWDVLFHVTSQLLRLIEYLAIWR